MSLSMDLRMTTSFSKYTKHHNGEMIDTNELIQTAGDEVFCCTNPYFSEEQRHEGDVRTALVQYSSVKV
jgi:hypothetical protein